MTPGWTTATKSRALISMMRFIRANDRTMPPRDGTQPPTEPKPAPPAAPLPWGEGEPVSARRTFHSRRLSTAYCALFPLPEGEGQGEGNGGAAPRQANLFALARDDCAADLAAVSNS